MVSGDMWWARTIIRQTHQPSWTPLPGFARRSVPEGVEFSGTVKQPAIGWAIPINWQVEVRSDYFLDPPRMPATGEPFISMPKMKFNGALGLLGGDFGTASCIISFRQILRWGDEITASSDVNWNMGYVSGKNIMFGKQVLAPQKRDFGALFFNLDRTQTLSITLVTTFRFSVLLGGVIGFAPLVFGAPQWKVYSLD